MPKPVGKPRQEIRVDHHITENEQIVLASMMRDHVALRDLYMEISRDSFISDRHKVIFSVLQSIASQKLKFELETFYQLAGNTNYGGREYIKNLYNSLQKSPENLDWYVERLQINAVKIKLRVGSLQGLVDAAENPNCTLDDLSRYIQRIHKDISGHISKEVLSGGKLYESYLANWKARRQNVGFVPTGFWELDKELTEGLARKKMSVWSARTGMGKSTTIDNVIERITRTHNKKIIHFSLEMPWEDVVDGIVSCRTNILLDKIIKDPQSITRGELKLINQTAKDLISDNNIVFYDSRPTFEQLPKILSEDDYDIAIFDLWEKMLPNLEVNTISEKLDVMQGICKETDTHLALVHQLRRPGPQNNGKRPQLTELKGSGKWEEAADLIMFLHRDKYYDPDVPNNIMEFLVAKQRRGQGHKIIPYEFEPEYHRIGKYVNGYLT